MDFLAKKAGYDPEDEDFEFVFSFDDEPNPHTLLALKVEDSLKDEAIDFYKVSPTN